MDIARIMPFIQSVHHVFETMLQLPVEIGEPRCLDAGGEPHDVVVVSEVGGSCEGSVAMVFEGATAERIVALLTGSEVAINSCDFADGACELFGMICGGAGTRLAAGRAVFSMPTVAFRADPLAARVRSGAPSVVLPCVTDCGPFGIVLSLAGLGETASGGPDASCAGACLSLGGAR